MKFTDDERDDLAEKAAEIISKDHEKPYFMLVSMINPHDICYMAEVFPKLIILKKLPYSEVF